MRIFGPNELTADVQQAGLCIGCGACVDLCPYFRNYRGLTARLFECTLPRGRCHAHCPKAEVDLEELSRAYWNEPYEGTPLGRHLRIAAARCRKPAGGRFQGGGTVSALISCALEAGLVEAAVLTGQNGIEPAPRLATRVEEVAACAASKFIAAPTLAALNLALREGKRRLGVVGTPCQMTAVALMRLNPLQRDDGGDPVALGVGLFCNWALDHRLLCAYLDARMDRSRITGMDIPPPPAGVLVAETPSGPRAFPLEEIRKLIPPTCFICPDMTAEWSDVSVGMLEGRHGWNTLIVRTPAGGELVDRAAGDGWLEIAAVPEANLAGLTAAARAKKERSLRNAERKGLVNQSGEDRRCALRLPAEVLRRLLG